MSKYERLKKQAPLKENQSQPRTEEEATRPKQSEHDNGQQANSRNNNAANGVDIEAFLNDTELLRGQQRMYEELERCKQRSARRKKTKARAALPFGNDHDHAVEAVLLKPLQSQQQQQQQLKVQQRRADCNHQPLCAPKSWKPSRRSSLQDQSQPAEILLRPVPRSEALALAARQRAAAAVAKDGKAADCWPR